MPGPDRGARPPHQRDDPAAPPAVDRRGDHPRRPLLLDGGRQDPPGARAARRSADRRGRPEGAGDAPRRDAGRRLVPLPVLAASVRGVGGDGPATAAEAGRDLVGFDWCVWVFVNINPDGDIAREEAARSMGGTYNQDFPPMVDSVAAAGTVPEVTAKVQAFYDAGLDTSCSARPLRAPTPDRSSIGCSVTSSRPARARRRPTLTVVFRKWRVR